MRQSIFRILLLEAVSIEVAHVVLEALTALVKTDRIVIPAHAALVVNLMFKKMGEGGGDILLIGDAADIIVRGGG